MTIFQAICGQQDSQVVFWYMDKLSPTIYSVFDFVEHHTYESTTTLKFWQNPGVNWGRQLTIWLKQAV